jgi:hypothetical protein
MVQCQEAKETSLGVKMLLEASGWAILVGGLIAACSTGTDQVVARIGGTPEVQLRFLAEKKTFSNADTLLRGSFIERQLAFEIRGKGPWEQYFLHTVNLEKASNWELVPAGDGIRFGVRANSGSWVVVYWLSHARIGYSDGWILERMTSLTDAIVDWTKIPSLEELPSTWNAPGAGFIESDREAIRQELSAREKG